MPVIQPGNRRHIGAYKAWHTELPPKYVGENLMVGGNRLPVDGIIGTHGVPCASVHESLFKDRHTVGENIPSAHCGGRAVQSGHGSPVAHIMLRFRSYGIRGFQICSLHALYDLPGKFPAQIGIFPEGFLHTAVPGIPGQIHDS